MKTLLCIALAALPLLSQVTGAPRRSVRASGQAEISVRPDQVRVSVSIVTRAATADAASEANATRTTAVIAALRALVGNAGEIRTSSFSVVPIREGNPPRDAGFQVSNSLLVTSNNTNLAGRLIDTAIQAGATNVGGISLGLRDDEPIRLQALRAAGQVAKTRAEAVASGIGVRLGAVLSADENSVLPGNVIPANRISLAAGAATPIETGTLSVYATVSVEYEIIP